MKTREQALADLARFAAEQRRMLDTLTPEQVADRAWRPGGPSREELAERFAAYQRRVGLANGNHD